MTENDLGQRRKSKDGPFRRLVDRLNGVPALMPRVLEAIDSLHTEGVTEPREKQIYKREQELHLPQHPWQTVQPGTFFRTLDVLAEEGRIEHRWVTANEAVETHTDMGYAYHIVAEQTTPAPTG
jgi:hypothetical protein